MHIDYFPLYGPIWIDPTDIINNLMIGIQHGMFICASAVL